MSDTHRGRRGSFLENTLKGLHTAMERALYAESAASQNGLLQRLDPRVKVAGLSALVLSAALATKLWMVAAVLLLAVLLAVISAIPMGMLAGRAWIGALFFSAALAAPALFLTPGTALWGSPVTLQGARSAGFLVLRAEAATTLMLVLAYTTPWTHILKALRIFRVPVVFVVILGMTCRYILLLLQTAHEIFESRQSRTVARVSAAENRRMAISGAGVLLGKTLHLSGEVYLAMQSRGFRGEVYLLDEFEMQVRDWVALGAFATLATISIVLGR